MEDFRILAINPGSTSTKIAVYHNMNPVFVKNITHPSEELAQFEHVADQFHFLRVPQLRLQQLESCPRQMVLAQPLLQRLAQQLGRTRLGQKPENVALVDGLDRRLHVGKSREHDAHGLGERLLHAREKLDAIHAAGHPQIGNHDGKGSLSRQQFERLGGAAGGGYIEVFAQVALVALQQIVLLLQH